MGLLSLGTPFTFSENGKYVKYVHSHAVLQLKNAFKSNIDRDHDPFLWGDEIEYMLVNFNQKSHRATLDCEHDHFLIEFDPDYQPEGENSSTNSNFKTICVPNDILYHPEYGRFMIEATPLAPYNGDSLKDYSYVQHNMAKRREIMVQEFQKEQKNELSEKVIPLTITTFPLMGVPGFTSVDYPINSDSSHSLFLPSEITNRHVRFPTLTKNIRTRRGSKIAINVPIFPDRNTQSLTEIDQTIPKRSLFEEDRDPFYLPTKNGSAEGAALPGHIYMDAMGFGMGSSCLQVTMQTSNIDDARYLYDALIPVAPIFLSLSAAAPIFKGILADQDVRWNVISNAVDDRNPFERGLSVKDEVKDDSKSILAGGSDPNRTFQRIYKSRYDSISQYLGDFNHSKKSFNFYTKEYNDLLNSKNAPLPLNKEIFDELLKDPNFDETLAAHFAYLFVRDPLVIFSEKVKAKSIEDDQYDDDHFLNIQSTNWNSVRFKPPQPVAPGEKIPSIGWRVEFRPMDIQITDFENAAYSCFIVLLSKALLKYRPNLYMKMSNVDSNMETAHKRNSLLNEKFYFRKFSKIFDDNTDEESENLVTIDEIINGNNEFIGFVPLIRKLLDETYNNKEQNEETTKQLKVVDLYLKLISGRASGKYPTIATFIRNFVRSHKEYKFDSMISHEINYDLLVKLAKISEYEDDSSLQELFGEEISEFLKE